MNHYIDELESKAYGIHARLVIKKRPFNAKLIKNKLLNKEDIYKTLLSTYDEHNTQIEQLVSLDYSYGAYRRHISTRNHLAAFINKEFKLEDLFIAKVDLNFIKRFHTF